MSTPDIELCRVGIALSTGGVTVNEEMDQDQYLLFVNRQSGQSWFDDTYDTLPDVLKTNFVNLSVNNAGTRIVLTNAHPQNTPSTPELTAITNFCTETEFWIGVALAPPTPSPTTPAPTGPTTFAPSLSLEPTANNTNTTQQFTRAPSAATTISPFISCVLLPMLVGFLAWMRP